MTDSAKPNNPAARLLAILQEMKTTNAQNIAAGFAAVFGTNPSDLGEIYRCLGQVDRTIDEVAERLRLCGNTDFEQVYQTTVPRLKRAFSVTHFGQQWEEFKRQTIFDQEIKALEFCSAALARHYADKVVAAEELKDLLNKVNTLYGEVWDAHIDERLKTIILEELANIRRAIHDYKIRGAEGLNESVARVMFIMAAVERVEPQNRKLIEKVRDLADDIIRIATVGTFLYELYENLKKSLPHAAS